MKKTDFGIKIDSIYDCSICDGDFYAYFDLRNSKDDLGRPLKNYLVFSFEKGINRMSFIRCSEDVDGDSTVENVNDRLYFKTKRQIIERATVEYKKLVH